MEGKIIQVTVVVTDQTKAVEFYTEKAGFEKKTDFTAPTGYRYVTVGLKGQELELSLFQAGTVLEGEQSRWAKEWTPGKRPPIVLQVADCRATHQELAGRGVTFPQPPLDHPWGVTATFSDPDGNLFSINQMKGWAKT